MPGPLHGYRIVDLTSNVSGPLATMMLADQGADVIKVEPPDGGDHTRAAAQPARRVFGVVPEQQPQQALDRSRPQKAGGGTGAAALGGWRRCPCPEFSPRRRRTARRRRGCGARGGAKDRLCLDQRLWRDGPYAAKPVYDPVIQAFSGLATVQAGSDAARPRLLRTILPDKLTAITASQAITAALLARERTGEGQHVRLSMLEAVLAFLWSSDMGSQTFVGDEPATQEAASAADLIYETADGYITVAVQTDRQWQAMARTLGHGEWLDDPRFRTTALRQHNIDERLRLTQEALRTRPTAEWLEMLTAAEVPCGPVLTRNQVIRHPQVAALGLVVETEHKEAGRLRQTRAAARFSGTPAEIRHGAPALGEHTQEILAELGYSPAEIAALHAEGTLNPVAQQ